MIAQRKVSCGRLIILVTAVFYFCGMTSVSAAEQLIRVGLESDRKEVRLSSDDSLEISELTAGGVLLKTTTREKVTIAFTKQGLSLNGKNIRANALRVRSVKKTNAEQSIEVENRSYRGEIEIVPETARQRLKIINVLPLEHYLYGIIAREISPDWQREAVKAQAVAARSYALHSIKKHEKDGYDVCASTDCQVYGGKDAESANGNLAVDATRGEIISYQGKPIAAYFHSSSGGYTENSENVWGQNSPYIKGVADFDQNSPYYYWEKQISRKLFEAKLKNAGYGVGRLKGIELSELTKQRPLHAADRGVSGRVKSLRLIGEAQSKTVSGTQLRNILGLNSTLFDLKAAAALPQTKASGAKESSLRLFSAGQDDNIVFIGYGWGHGLGLSQWGAKALAEKYGQSSNYYKEILRHYYSGVELRKAY